MKTGGIQTHVRVQREMFSVEFGECFACLLQMMNSERPTTQRHKRRSFVTEQMPSN